MAENKVSAAPETPAPMIRVENLSKRFGTIQALKQISFEVQPNEILGFLGPNGAGKTTAMRILTAYFPPSEGKVWINGENLFDNPHELKRLIGYLPETISLYRTMTVNEMLKFVASLRGVASKIRKKHLEEKMAQCGLWEVRNRVIGTLSKGFRQRMGLAQALVGDPKVLILDEPTTGLDPKQIIEIRNLIRHLSKERTVILSSHILPEVSAVCDKILIMNKGQVVASGTADELEADVSKRQEIRITVGDRRKKKQAAELLEGLPGIEKINMVEKDEDEVEFSLSLKKGTDLRPMITRMFVENQIPILEIRSGRLSLEEIFMKVVAGEQTPARTNIL